MLLRRPRSVPNVKIDHCRLRDTNHPQVAFAINGSPRFTTGQAVQHHAEHHMRPWLAGVGILGILRTMSCFPAATFAAGCMSPAFSWTEYGIFDNRAIA